MSLTLLAARVLMAGALGLAGATKVLDPAGLARAAVDLRVRPSLAAVVGRVLPPIELAVAVLLVVGSTGWWAALFAAALFAAFSVLVATNLAAGNRPACHCFGEFRAEPIGASTLARNLALLALAVFVLIAGVHDAGPGAIAWASARVGAGRLAGLLAALAALQAAYVIARLGRDEGQNPRKRKAGLAVGVPSPEWVAPDLGGVDISLTELRRRAQGKSLLLLFVDPNCGPCGRLLPEVRSWETATDLSVVVVGSGDVDANAAKAREAGLEDLLVARGNVVAELYRYEGTPGAVVVDSAGRVASPVASGAVAIRALVSKYVRPTDEPVPMYSPLPGEDVPPFNLPDLDGVMVDLGSFGGRQTVVVFWDPMSPACQEMLPALRTWEATRPDECQLVVVSQGSLDANRALGFRSTVVLDDDHMTTRMYGVVSAPAALLVDSRVRIAGPTVHGAAEVLALLDRAAKLSEAAVRLSRPSTPVAAPVRKRRAEPSPTPGARRGSGGRGKTGASRRQP